MPPQTQRGGLPLLPLKEGAGCPPQTPPEGLSEDREGPSAPREAPSPTPGTLTRGGSAAAAAAPPGLGPGRRHFSASPAAAPQSPAFPLASPRGAPLVSPAPLRPPLWAVPRSPPEGWPRLLPPASWNRPARQASGETTLRQRGGQKERQRLLVYPNGKLTLRKGAGTSVPRRRRRENRGSWLAASTLQWACPPPHHRARSFRTGGAVLRGPDVGGPPVATATPPTFCARLYNVTSRARVTSDPRMIYLHIPQ